ncbi:carboxylesterase family protein [Streptomyces sp. CB03238]|uniref:carboxylesterase/lipase family protein n=1 Tax=Streptomyces sp. CB03238 TaxID=1907777 RepID=UPI000A11565D|nr:carboxylesterase family protein [Streptomyces sp. CB03238]ORT56421.1 carboxylesterase [Streptomyces sp. CB03238]
MDTVVTIEQGRLRGRVTDKVASFLGIPYAAAPRGDELYRAPAPPERWDGVRDAVGFGPTAPAPAYPPALARLLPEPSIPGEDFLNLNVWTPDPGASGLPVFVWIHGGAFMHGSSAVPTYDGHAFARDGVVFVSLNYRLGVPGFALFPDAPANLGLRDQLAALAWVQENIAAFGGDPRQVTVAGESAGAMSVVSLLSSDHSAGLFHRAVAQSGAGQGFVTAEDARLVTAEAARLLGVEPTARAFASVALPDLLTAQRRISADLGSRPGRGRYGPSVVAAAMPFPPVVDGDVLERPPLDAIAAGAGQGVPLLTGTTTEEQRLFLVPTGAAGAIGADALRSLATPAVADAYAGARPDATPGDVLAAVLTDRYFRLPAIRMAEARARAGATTHMYEFAWRTPVGNLGACHALEIGFAFDTLDRPGAEGLAGREAPKDLARRMHAAWVAFTAHGDPGWEPYGLRRRPVMVFDHPEQGVVEDPRGEERRLWN